jgi:hypothetical protein
VTLALWLGDAVGGVAGGGAWRRREGTRVEIGKEDGGRARGLHWVERVCWAIVSFGIGLIIMCLSRLLYVATFPQDECLVGLYCWHLHVDGLLSGA